MTPRNDDISTIEELDPEPERTGGPRWWRSPGVRELVLGLLLLSGVFGWAGYLWWRDADNSSNYSQATQAATLQRWDEALTHYSAASGYKDADARAAEARGQIKARDSQYRLAKDYQQTGSALQTLLAARAVQTIQPDYKDVAQVAAQAESQVYTDALSDTVVMRAEASPPGLYYRGPAGWEYLEGSDRWSSVLSIPFGASKRQSIVYDVPGPDWTPPVPLTRPLYDPYGYIMPQGSPDKVGRRLVMDTLSSGEQLVVKLQFSPLDYNFYICGQNGVWGLRYDPSISETPIAKGILNSFTWTYEEVGGKVAPVVIDSTRGTVADIGQGGAGGHDMLLFARRISPDNKAAGTQLYLAGADGSNPRFVYTTTIPIISALLSGDGKHALVVEAQPIEGINKATVAASLLTLDGSVPPITLQKVPLGGFTDSSGMSSLLTGQLSISGVFLQKGAFKGKLLLGWANGTPASSVTVWLLDVSDPGKPLVEATIPYAHTGSLPVLEGIDGSAMLLYNQGVPAVPVGDKWPAASLLVLRAVAGTNKVEASSYSVPVPLNDTSSDSTPYFMNPTLRGANLVYSVETFSTMPDSSSVYSLTLPDKASTGQVGEPGQPVQIFSRTWPAGRIFGKGGANSGVAGPGAYAYTDNVGALHAHQYGANVDVQLEKGVGAIFALNSDEISEIMH
ncbi:MAG: hypothetical protein IVW55_01035 [Chloroflexi bacterium]|nr:hypothetical protein [Chloroflexota bacterium]